MKFRPRNDIVLVERLTADVKQTASGIYVPGTSSVDNLAHLKVLAVGSKVEDLKAGDIVWAEGLYEKITKDNDRVVIVNQNKIHLVEEYD